MNSGAKTKMERSVKEARSRESRAQLGKFQPVEDEVLFRLQGRHIQKDIG